MKSTLKIIVVIYLLFFQINLSFGQANVLSIDSVLIQTKKAIEKKEFDQASQFLEKIKESDKLTNDQRYENLVFESKLYYINRNIDEALETLKRALSLKEAFKNKTKKEQSGVYLNLAILYSITSQFDSAESAINAALTFDTTDRYLFNLQASIYREKGNFEEALRLLIGNIKHFESTNNLNDLFHTYADVAVTFISLPVPKEEKAIEYYTKAIAIADSTDYISLNKGAAALNLGELYSTKKNVDQNGISKDSVIKYFGIAEKEFSTLKDSIGLARIYSNLSYFYYGLNQIKTAKQLAFKVVKINDKIPYTFSYNAYQVLIDGYIKESKLDSAKYFFGKLTAYDDYILLNSRIAYYRIGSKLFKATGNYSKENEFLNLLVSLKDSLDQVNNEYVIQELEKQYQAEKSKVKIQELEKEKIQNELHNSQSKLFYGAIISILVIILLSIFLYMNYIRNRSRKQVGVLKNQALRLQINPHFFFNALNSINKYIGNNEPIQAKSYLSKFAKVMRLSLESVQEDVVSLEQEIEFLINYLEIEKLQHKNFEYEISVDPNIDAAEIAIPPIIIQPYVENSILHGFINKTEDNKGYLKVSFTKEGKNLRTTISDDGVGVNQTIKTKSESSKHKSLALSITQKRLNAFSRKKVKVNISANQEDGGTNIDFLTPIIAF